MHQPFTTLLTCQHYELLTWACQAESQAQHIAEAAWRAQQHRWTSARQPATDAAAPHTQMLPCLALAFEAAYDQTVTQRLSRMAQTVQAACAGTWHWNPGDAGLPWHQLPAELRASIDALDSTQSPAQWLAVGADVVHTLSAIALENLQCSILNYQQALAKLRAALAPYPADGISGAYSCTTG